MIKTLELQDFDSTVGVKLFNMEERVSTIIEKRGHQVSCPTRENQDIRYVLFIVDASGSIGENAFETVKNLLALISEKLCDNLRVAMITYGSDDINLEFCFNCTSNRREIVSAIQRVRYRHSPSTRTTDATTCACQTMLAKECGLPHGPDTPNIDVVYLTDGSHNGPCRSNLKKEVNCFHRPGQTNINTYAIAIGDSAYESVQALENRRNLGDMHLFNIHNFKELQEVFEAILHLLKQVDLNGKARFTCISHDQEPCRK